MIPSWWRLGQSKVNFKEGEIVLAISVRIFAVLRSPGTSLSSSTASSSIVTQIRDSWAAPAVGLLHWHGKLMGPLRNKYRKEERLPVSVSDAYHRQSIKRINAKNIK